MVVVVELDPAGAEPTVPGSVVVVLEEQEKQPVAVPNAKSTSIEQPKRAIIRCAILVDFMFLPHDKSVEGESCMGHAGAFRQI